MIVLISPEKDVVDEIPTLNQLFEAGLGIYHLRKPERNQQEYADYLNQVDVQYHDRIVLHDHHELVNTYSLKGIHFQEQNRRDNIDNPSRYFLNLDMYGKSISSSFHEPEELADCAFEFDYHLLSPVFSSISKQGYAGRGFDVTQIDKRIIGMGGVSVDNVEAIKALGYKGIGLLGAIWQAENPMKAFEEIQDEYKKCMVG